MANKMDRDTKIVSWLSAQESLNHFKKMEADLRNEILKEVFNFNSDDLREGTENFDLGSGYSLKASFKITKSFVKEISKVKAILAVIENAFPEGNYIVNRLVKWRPSLSASEYKTLPEEIRKIFDELIISKEAMPTLEMVIEE